ncbi:DedA family protein [Candidatus Falkowbacteria bacterium]|nr:DedA family protein [Candidatus Falkowbacteria bacterium]
MIHALLEMIGLFVINIIAQFGYWAVFGLMALESANVPIPSEVILTYAGFLSSRGVLNFHLSALAGALGCLVGSVISYAIGLKLGRPFLWRYGKWVLVSQKDLLFAERFLDKYGTATYFFSRMLPVVRTFISLVIGVSKGNFIKSNLYGFFASWIWSYVLVYVGLKLGDNWQSIKPWWDKFSYLVVAAILVAVIWHIFRVLRSKNEPLATPQK